MESEFTETDVTCPNYGEVRTNREETNDDKTAALQSEVDTIWRELDLIREECTRGRRRCMESSLAQTISDRTGEWREVNRSGRRGIGRGGRGRDGRCRNCFLKKGECDLKRRACVRLKGEGCLACLQFGHFAAECTIGIVCRNCQELGHKVRACPQYNSRRNQVEDREEERTEERQSGEVNSY